MGPRAAGAIPAEGRPRLKKRAGIAARPETRIYREAYASSTATIANVAGSITKIWSRTRMNS